MGRINFFLFSLYLVLALPAGAADIHYPTKPFKEDLTLPAGKPLIDLYALGRVVTVAGAVKGDAFVLGKELHFQGPVQWDVDAAAGSIHLESSLGGSAHLLGGSIWVSGQAGRDLLVVAKEVNASSKAVVLGDVALVATSIHWEGKVQGRLFAAAQTLEINAPLRRGAVLHYEKDLLLGPECRTSGKIECYGPIPPRLQAGTIVPTVEFHPITPLSALLGRWTSPFGWPALLGMLGWFLTAWLLKTCSPTLVHRVVREAHGPKWKDLGLGLALLFFSTLVGVLLALSVIGLLAALIIALVLFSILLIGRVMALFVLGHWLARLFQAKVKGVLPMGWVAAAILVLHLTACWPWIGCTLSAFLTLGVLGLFFRLVRKTA